MLSSDVSSQQGPSRFVPPEHWRHLVVLVAEDHSAYRLLLGWFMQKLGLGHEVVGDGCEGLACITRRRFDLVISDCHMPRMDGYALARAIRLHELENGQRRVPIIALTANLLPDDPQRCRDAGMDAWLLKPLTFAQLCEVLARWLPGPPCEMSAPESEAAMGWPTRAGMVQTFGSEQVVDQMLASLLYEARNDCADLAHARITSNTQVVLDRLHRLLGGLAFLGCDDLEVRGSVLIEQVRTDGVAVHLLSLEVFERDLERYFAYVSAL
ncbi:response regulator [Pseudomonas sp. IB20]|uniref:response regulator n=1 Tax=Pseudomonas sp. IB20 TaxID=1702250 RepID=UPI000BA050F8|nr:response regulator [Pseudomonas sp. IB20]OZO02948.1 response regulator [Pseudomonas sp. IB20]